MDCPTHAHYRWDCPHSNGRHLWFITWKDIPLKIQTSDNKIGIPVHCACGCGAWGTEYYEYKETIEHAHQKWSCPRSNGRHLWLIDWDKIYKMHYGGDKIAVPVKCGYGCGAYAIEFYEYKETIEGE